MLKVHLLIAFKLILNSSENNIFTTIQETKGGLISQVCVTEIGDFHSFFNYNDTFIVRIGYSRLLQQ